MNDPVPQTEVYYLNQDSLEAGKQLQPQPKQQPRAWEPIRSSPCTVLFAHICLGLALLGSIKTYELLAGPYPLVNECDNTEHISFTEKQFQINIRAISGLSFAQAKLIDLAWDLGVGHGGRLLHGWILYRIACNTITWSLEHTSLPYHFLLSLLFWPDSVSSLWTSVKYLAGKRRPGILVPVVLLTYAIGHVLFYGALFSAMTGYQSVGKAAFAMPDGSWVASDNDTLRFCWSLDPKRLAPSSADDVVLGPRFGSVFKSFSDFDDAASGTGRMWDTYHNVAGDMSDDFNNLYSYARSRATMQNFLRKVRYPDSTTWYPHGNPTKTARIEVAEWKTSINSTLDEFDRKGFQELSYNYTASDKPSEGKIELPLVIKGWQFLGEGQKLSTSSEELVLITYREDSESHARSTTQFLEANFHLDASVPSGPEIVPYNSTAWYNGTKIALQAPFLDLGFKSCPWSRPLLGECICYEGRPLTKDFRFDTNKLCIGGDQYIWGFSRSILFIGITLEVIWCFACLILLLLSTQQSNLVRYHRPTVGIIRTILDLAESLNRDLGPDTSWYTEKQLEKRLSGHLSVGYRIWDKDNVTGHIGLVPLPERGSTERRLLVKDFRTS